MRKRLRNIVIPLVAAVTLAVIAAFALAGCSGDANASGGSSGAQPGPAASPSGASGSSGGGQDGSTSGPAYSEPTQVLLSPFSEAEAEPVRGGYIDVSHVDEGYAAASCVSDRRLKLQVVNGQNSYNYDLPSDGTPIVVPMNMGDGQYQIRVMANTSGSSYAELGSVSADVQLESEFAPYLRPSMFCDYTADSAAVAKARELAAGATNEGDVVRAIYDWMTANVTYDTGKAAQLASATGYVPDPDTTLQEKTGICFDYASLAAAMFRSLGIPCKIMSGYVDPGDIYHAWNLIYIDGQWVSAEITVDADEWSRIDLTFAADDEGVSGASDNVSYTDRYTY